ncbi:MAG: methyltransferase family protein [Pyrinomonadaceae bacterium]
MSYAINARSNQASMELPTLVFVIVMVCWVVFALIFLLRKKPPVAPDKKRDRGSIPGLLLQGLSYAIVWTLRRPLFTPFLSTSKSVAITIAILAIVTAIGSVSIVMASVKTLGKEWSITARVVTGHKLATKGPYQVVRHPIYTGMLGMLLATGIAVSYWPALLVATIVFFIGTAIRIRIEERLLRETFGQEFEAYARSVPALVPGLY